MLDANGFVIETKGVLNGVAMCLEITDPTQTSTSPSRLSYPAPTEESVTINLNIRTEQMLFPR